MAKKSWNTIPHFIIAGIASSTYIYLKCVFNVLACDWTISIPFHWLFNYYFHQWYASFLLSIFLLTQKFSKMEPVNGTGKARLLPMELKVWIYIYMKVFSWIHAECVIYCFMKRQRRANKRKSMSQETNMLQEAERYLHANSKCVLSYFIRRFTCRSTNKSGETKNVTLSVNAVIDGSRNGNNIERKLTSLYTLPLAGQARKSMDSMTKRIKYPASFHVGCFSVV